LILGLDKRFWPENGVSGAFGGETKADSSASLRNGNAKKLAGWAASGRDDVRQWR